MAKGKGQFKQVPATGGKGMYKRATRTPDPAPTAAKVGKTKTVQQARKARKR
jgi:hypothetical protein